MTAKHTPGSWTALPEEVDRPYIRIRGTRLGGRYKVANVLTPDHEGVHEREAVETRANARLIAAAPDLLFELEGLVNFSDAFGLYGNDPLAVELRKWIAGARAAIAKATGEAA